MKKRKGKKKFAWNPKNKVLYNMMASSLGVTVINWVLQDILGMDTSERWFKVSLDIVLTLILIPFFLFFFTFWPAMLLALVLAHTINWLFNGHFFDAVGRFHSLCKMTLGKMIAYLQEIELRAKRRNSLLCILVIGGITRGQKIRNTSDVDIRFVRKKGFWNGLAANFGGMNERTRALFAKFPLDLYVYDDTKSLDRLRKDEKPIIVYDPNKVLREKYKKRGYTMLCDVIAKKWDEEDQKSV